VSQRPKQRRSHAASMLLSNAVTLSYSHIQSTTEVKAIWSINWYISYTTLHSHLYLRGGQHAVQRWGHNQSRPNAQLTFTHLHTISSSRSLTCLNSDSSATQLCTMPSCL